MYIVEDQRGKRIRPLERLTVRQARGTHYAVSDGIGNTYAEGPVSAEFTITAAGALGTHTLRTFDDSGQLLETRQFLVDAQTRLADEGGQFRELLTMVR